MNNIKLHLHKYFFYDLLAIFLFIILSWLGIKLYNDYQINKKLENDFSYFDRSMMQIYDVNPSLFKFDDNGVAKVEMKDLLKPITNGEDTVYFGVVPLTSQQDQCVGYIIVEKYNDDLKFDYSHLCDMIDY